MTLNKEEKEKIENIIDRYRKVSDDLSVSLKEAEKIRKRVEELKNLMNYIKGEEDTLMEELHRKHGEFGLQDIYEQLNDGDIR